MDVSLKFLGGVETVTGSKHLLTIDNYRILIDCGMFQGLKELRLRNWERFPIDVTTINTVIITHAHIDHIGYLPKLVKEGFKGAIYCTPATADLLIILLKDSAKLQEEEAEIIGKKGYSKHEKPLPLYDSDDVEAVLPLIKVVDFGEATKITPQISFTYRLAGHILGAATVDIQMQGERMSKNIVFSGDLGRYNDVLLPSPEAVEHADYLVIESTYGNRKMEEEDTLETLVRIIRHTFHNNGCVVIPAFAVGRTQQLLYFFKQIINQQLLPPFPVYVDSPMAIEATKLYRKYLYDYNKEAISEEFFDFPNLHYCRKQEESAELHFIKRGAVIISASGMATGGRILQHLYNRLPNPQDTVIFSGFQAAATRGRRILEGEETIKIYGEPIAIKCNIEKLEGLSAHGDQDHLLQWASNIKNSPKKVFIVHGEPDSAAEFGKLLQEKLNWKTEVPNYLESFVLFEGI